MTGIKITSRDVTVSHPILWADPEELPVTFVLVKEGAVGLASPDYVAGELYDIATGDLALADAWDFLMVKTPKNSHPEICRVRLIGNDGGAEILVGSHIVHRFS